MDYEPHADRVGQKFNMQIRRNLTGATRTCESWGTGWLSHTMFLMKEGNLACDCNRAASFFEDHDTDYPCGDTDFSIVSVTFEDGTIITVDGNN